MGSTIKTDSTSDYSALLAEYKKMQTTAYTSKTVTAPQLDVLKKKIDSYLSDHVADSTEKDKMLAAVESGFKIMGDAINLKESHGKTSDQTWDTAREDMQSLLAEIAPEGSDEEVYDPTMGKETIGGAGSSTSGAQLNNLASTGIKKVDASGADMTGVDDYVAQNPAAKPYVSMVAQASVSYSPHTPVRALLAQINAESGFNPNALGRFGEQGMTQFTKETWESMGMGDYAGSWDPQTAINAQAKYMAQLQQQNGGNLAYALESFNGWERDKSYDYNVGKKCSPTYVQDSLGTPYDQRKDSTG